MPSLNELRWVRALPLPAREMQEELRARTWQRLERTGMAGHGPMEERKYVASRFELLTMLAFPEADLPGLEVVNDFHLYLFYVDDVAEEDESFGKNPERLKRYFENHVAAIRDGAPVPSDDGAGRLLLDIRERLVRCASPAWLRRFAHDVEQYLMLGTLPGARHWTAETVPGLAEYIDQRGFDSAVFCMQDLYEVTGPENRELPEIVARRQELRELRRLCTNVVAFANDLVSYPKEVRRHGSPNNLVHVIMRQEQRALEPAIARVIGIVNGDVAQFDAIYAAFPDFGAEARTRLAHYVAGQRAFMNGNIAWSIASGRYLDPESPFPELRAAPLTVRAETTQNVSIGGLQ